MQFKLSGRLMVATLLLAGFAVFIVFDLPRTWEAATFIVAIIAAYEWGRLCGYSRADCILYSIIFVVFALLAAWLGSEQAVQYIYLQLVAVFWILLAPWIILKRWAIRSMLLSALGLLLLYAVWHAAVFLYEYDFPLLLSSFALVWLFDSGCYFVGRSIGTTKLALHISPKKTVEGLLGGLGIVFIGGMIYSTLPAVNNPAPIAVVSAAFSLAILSLLGDLFISLLKRNAGVKDSGSLLGEHGGILDRMDSLLPVLPVVMLLSPWSG